MRSSLKKKYKKNKNKIKFSQKNNNSQKKREKYKVHIEHPERELCYHIVLLYLPLSVILHYPSLSFLVFLVCHRFTSRPATRTSALDIYSILLSDSDLCATIHIYILTFQAPDTYFCSVQLRPLQSPFHSLTASPTSHRLYRPLLCFGKNLVRAR